MAAKPTPTMKQIATRDLWRLVVFCTVVAAAMLPAAFKVPGELEWPEWLVWISRVLAVGAIAALWHSSAGLLLQEIRRRRG
jgi:hypothetical protein